MLKQLAQSSRPTAVAGNGSSPRRSTGSPARLLGLLGPALVAGVAYLDPGNVASNTTAGAKYGYLLVWVVVTGNAMAWLVQYLSAKLGVVTRRSLADLLGDTIGPRWIRRAYWLQAELVAVATDVAEVIGGAVALSLLFDLPLVLGGAVTGLVSLLVLLIQGSGRQRTFERVIISLLLVIVVGFSAGVILDPPPVRSVLGGMVPGFEGHETVLLAASILGATIMPHAIYAHSALARDRFGQRPEREGARRLLSATRWDVTIALVVAGSVNLAIMLMAATSLSGIPGTESLEGAYAGIAATSGSVVATVFAVGLLASGLASTAVGAYAGGEIMHGLLRIRIPLLTRRLCTLLPALAVLAIGVDPTRALIWSQIVLSFGIPFAVVPLVWFTSRPAVMGEFANRTRTTLAGAAVATVLVVLNATLLVMATATS